MCWLRVLRSSRAVSESMPRSLNGRSGSRAAGSGWANTAAVVAVTIAVSVSSRCSGVWPANVAASVRGLAVAAWGRLVIRADRIGSNALLARAAGQRARC